MVEWPVTDRSVAKAAASENWTQSEPQGKQDWFH
jgi:hypothetical protein